MCAFWTVPTAIIFVFSHGNAARCVHVCSAAQMREFNVKFNLSGISTVVLKYFSCRFSTKIIGFFDEIQQLLRNFILNMNVANLAAPQLRQYR